MKRLLITLSLCITAIVVSAEDYKYLVLESTNGTYQLSTDGLILEFRDNNLVSSDGTSIPLTSLTKMYFSETMGVKTINKTAGDSPVHIYSIAGVPLGTFQDMASAISTLPKGIYIIKQANGHVVKYTAK